MDTIYEVLVTLDYPDGMTGGLRRLTDQVRGILERSRGDLTISMRQWELARYLGTRDIIAPHE
jgi:translin